MANEMLVSEVVKGENVSQDDRKACGTTPQPDEKQQHYISAVHPDKMPDLVHGQEQIMMMTPEMTMQMTDMGIYETLAVVPQQMTHLPTQHIPANSTAYYQFVPPPSYYNQQQQMHYATTAVQPGPAHADPNRAQIVHPYAAPTVMYVPMSYYQQETQPAIRHQTTIANVAPAGVTYHHVPVEYATAPVAQMASTPPQQQQQQVQSQTTATIAPSVNYRTGHRQRVVIWNYCQFCQNNKEPEEFYRSHTLRDPSGRILCPVLRAYNCPLCNNGGGDKAHTKSYCPQLRNRHQLNTTTCQAGRRQGNLHSGTGTHQQTKMKGHSQQFQTTGPVTEIEHMTA